jgi:hypothetical protein
MYPSMVLRPRRMSLHSLHADLLALENGMEQWEIGWLGPPRSLSKLRSHSTRMLVMAAGEGSFLAFFDFLRDRTERVLRFGQSGPAPVLAMAVVRNIHPSAM